MLFRSKAAASRDILILVLYAEITMEPYPVVITLLQSSVSIRKSEVYAGEYGVVR